MSLIKTNAITTVAGKQILNSTGSILQVVQSWDDTVRSGGGIVYPSYTTIASPQVTITPSSSTNKILLIAQVTFASGAAGNFYDTTYRLSRNGTGIGNATTGSLGSIGINAREQYELGNGSISYLDSPGTTSAVTYAIQVTTSDAGHNWKINESGAGDDRGVSCIIAMEVSY
jgi:hypothetical protein